MVKLSIIIPFYNTYELTCELLGEFRKQYTNEIEIFVIDDSNELRLDQFNDIANIYHFTKRQGLSKARNIGIDKSKGKYIAFVDSDDMISHNYVNVLLSAIDKYDNDIIVFNWKDKNTGSVNYRPENYAVWKAIYRREKTPKFNENMWYNEDVPFQAELDKLECTKIFIDYVLYYYNSGRQGSNMWERDEIRRKNMIKVEVIEDFTLERFDELSNIKRIGVETPGRLYVGDVFECAKDLADYLLGDNALKKVVVKLVEVIPEKVETKHKREVETEQPTEVKTEPVIEPNVEPKKKKKSTK